MTVHGDYPYLALTLVANDIERHKWQSWQLTFIQLKISIQWHNSDQQVNYRKLKYYYYYYYEKNNCLETWTVELEADNENFNLLLNLIRMILVLGNIS